ncbi:hypothetical protein BKK80_12500 [Cupriavidus malaysiensis]|uniref:Uncharacterized protein n=2 Tax=Cupriavidus malaysiensis TaxID=367825 RepID=A0A1D9I361_9BURK|nr:hypothetical protein BKK80_12500 [Cupriavidus malaysiensis]
MGFGLGMVLTAFTIFPPKSASDWAAWIQAVGSIGAIVGAYTIGQRQARASLDQAIHLRDMEIKAKGQAMTAVVEAATKHAASIRGLAERMPFVPFYGYWRLLGKEETEAVIRSIEALPLHELASADKVIAVTGIRSSLARVRSECAKLDEMENSPLLQLGYQKLAESLAAEGKFVEFHMNKYRGEVPPAHSASSA